ncbi:DUF5790 family protein [Haladaptatus sp. T7]|uniref:DUF5790 family protein n=1 Tax=Haladaptatus sp. T7 TaxID=2029368 RepID=UPI0021A25645|nr:DUF5790 family protein [Haladaptatus sp. T7]GKZ14201.1 hypothetical protein HAL_20820 [Haladaptatus sp. T7]
MSQSSFDDELFGEAANEMREDVEEHLAAAREELPPVEAVWETDAENTLGALNALRSALDVGDAEDHLHDAKKWYAMGQRADAFEDADDLKDEIETIDAAISDVEDAREQVGELASTIPSLKGSLEELEADDESDDDEAEESAGDDEVEAEEADAEEEEEE